MPSIHCYQLSSQLDPVLLSDLSSELTWQSFCGLHCIAAERATGQCLGLLCSCNGVCMCISMYSVCIALGLDGW